VAYRLNVGSFTGESSGLTEDLQGTFLGLIEKVPHFHTMGRSSSSPSWFRSWTSLFSKTDDVWRNGSHSRSSIVLCAGVNAIILQPVFAHEEYRGCYYPIR
jgi:hypothetical protein